MNQAAVGRALFRQPKVKEEAIVNKTIKQKPFNSLE